VADESDWTDIAGMIIGSLAALMTFLAVYIAAVGSVGWVFGIAIGWIPATLAAWLAWLLFRYLWWLMLLGVLWLVAAQ
jgi:hypothetical protein